MKNEYPLVTLITPSYNQGDFIEATIKSVLSQTYPHIEYIVLDAMSNDQTEEILLKYKDQIGTTVRAKDKGQSDAIVKGFKLANGELVGWINSDDILSPDCVQRVVKSYVENRSSNIFYSKSVDLISKDGAKIRTFNIKEISHESLLRKSTQLIQPGSFYKKSALEAVGYLDINLKYSMDLDLWLRLLKNGSATEVPGTALASYREWEGTKTSTGDLRLMVERKRLLFNHGARFIDPTISLLNMKIFKRKIKAIFTGKIVGCL